MSDLSAFLAQNALPVEHVKYAASKRFIDPETKLPMEWELRALTSEEDETLRKDCTRNVPVPMKKNQYAPQLDTTKYIGRLAASCVVFPDLNDSALQDSYHAMGAESLLKAMLLPGEYADLITEVQSINGFDLDMGEQVEEAKN